MLATFLLLGLLAASDGSLRGDSAPSMEAIEGHLKAREYGPAADAARARLSSLEAGGAAESVEGARLLDILVEAAWRGGLEDPEARAAGERAVALRTRLVGSDDPSVATSLHLLGNLSQARGDAAASRTYYERSLAIRERAFGPEAPEVVPSLNNLGNVTRSLGDLEASRRVLERALAIREKTLPPTSRDLARSHVSLGNTLSDLGVLEEAERHLAQAVEILDAQQARDQQLSSALNTQSVVLERQGRYEEAERTLRRAIEVERQTTAPTSDLPMYLGNLAVLRRDRGDLAEARAMQEEALRIEEASPSPDPTWRALLLNNQGHLFLLMGDAPGARPVLDQALQIQRRHLPADHPQIASTLQNLGHVSLRLGEPSKAREAYEQAVGILERTVGTRHRDYGQALVDLGTAYLSEGRFEEARDLLGRALGIFQETVGPGSLLTVKARTYLADAESALGRHEAARKGYEEAVAIARTTFGNDHLVLAEILARLSLVLALTGQQSEALDAALEAEATRVRVVHAALPVLPYRQALAFTATPGGLHVALSLASRASDPTAVRRTWDTLIQARALTLDEMVRRTSPTETGAALEVARNRYVQLLLKAEKAPVVDQARLEMERLEQVVAEAGARDRSGAQTEATVERIAAELSKGSALVAFVHFRDVLASAAQATAKDTYAAFVLRAGGDPQMIVLGPAGRMDGLVADWRREVTAPALAGMRKDSQARYDAAASALGKAAWTPLQPLLGGARTVLLVPDGSLQLVSFPSLRVSRSKYLAETGPRVHLLTAEREILRPPTSASGQGLLAVAAPDFDGGEPAADAGSTATPGPTLAVLRSAVHGGSFLPLPGTRTETARVASLWNATAKDAGSAVTVEGPAASEEAVRTGAYGKRVLHLATHGFFLSPEGGGAAEEYGVRALERWSRSGSDYVSSHNPLLLAGLALKGANRTLAGKPPQGQDGLLLAEELAALDLHGIEWVVLSACETGVGDLVPGEGIVGLRQAVLAGGARTVIMSLWRVEDEATAAWMEALYRARLASGVSTMEALERANRDVLSARRKAAKSTHPFYWAAFVAAGDWR